MTIIVERDLSLVEMFQSVLGDECTVLDSIDQVEHHLQASPQEYAVVLGPSVNAGAATAFAEVSRVSRPALGVILVRSRVDTAVLGDALRSGMREVVESRDLTGLAEAVRRAYGVWHAMSGGSTSREGASGGGAGQLFTVFSTKGGVGKSMLATNLAAALAAKSKRVCLVDLDVQNGDVAIMLQLFPTHSLADLQSLSAGLDPTGVRSLLTEASQSFSVLAAPVHVDGKEQVVPDAVGDVLQMLKSMFDMVVVDTSGSFDDYTLHAFDHSDLLLLIGTLDIPALKSVKLAAATLDLLNIPRESWLLVLNRADDKVGLSPGEFSETLGVEICCSIPSAREVLTAVNRGETIVTLSPRHAVSQSIQKLASRLVDRGTPASIPAQGRRRADTDEHRRGGLRRRKVR